MREVHALLAEGGEPEGAIRRTLRAAREAAGSRRTVLALVDGKSRELRPKLSDGDVTPDFLEKFRFPLAEGGALGEALRSGRPIHVFDIQMPYFRRILTAREVGALDAPSFVAVPVRKGAEGIGVLYADRAEGDDPFNDEELETLTSLADLVSLALRR